jgi:hypothetical protein
MKRKPLNKAKSARKFKKHVQYTKAANIPSKRTIQRGGQRM